MAITIDDLNVLQNYLNGVKERAEHHAGKVKGTCLTLAGAIILFRDENSRIEVKEYDGAPANILWCTINGTRYALCYEHVTSAKQRGKPLLNDIGWVEIRRGSFKGNVVAQLDDSVSSSQVFDIFKTQL